MSFASTRPRLLAAAGVVVAIAALTLAPAALVEPVRGAFAGFVDLVAAPALGWVPSDGGERLLNMVLFVPLGATLALLVGRRAFPVAVLAGFALSAAVEYAQASIPGRVPDVADVLWNSLGAATGAILIAVPRAVGAFVRARHRGSATRT